MQDRVPFKACGGYRSTYMPHLIHLSSLAIFNMQYDTSSDSFIGKERQTNLSKKHI